MKSPGSIAVLVIAAGTAAGQSGPLPYVAQCAFDSQGSKVCVNAQENGYVCGCYPSQLFGDCKSNPLYCHDVVVRKSDPDGQTIYTRVLGGESDQFPLQLLFDPQDDVVILGNTHSTQFPVTAGAVQTFYGGPAGGASSSPFLSGGDLFLSIISSSGGLAYSTFLGSSGDDRLLGVKASDGKVEVLVGAGAGNFPTLPASTATPSSGPVLLEFDEGRRSLIHSDYLPLATLGATMPYVARLQNDGTVTVATPTALYRFGSDGQFQASASLESLAFRYPPAASVDPQGDIWLVALNQSDQTVVAKLIGGRAEAFRWALPVNESSPVYLSSDVETGPFFGPDGLVYFAGRTSGPLQWTTPNAFLETPCYQRNFVFALDTEGGVKLLSYLLGNVLSFSALPDGSVVAVTTGAFQDQTVPMDLSRRPKVACITDPLDRGDPPGPAPGEFMRLRGGGFGPDSPVNATLGPDQRFPFSLGELSVEVGGIAAPILSVAPGEVVFAIPFAASVANTIPVVVKDHGLQSTAFPITVMAVAPYVVGPIFNGDGSTNSINNPAAWGSAVAFFVTGAGSFLPPLADGQAAPLDTSHRLQQPVSAGFSHFSSPYDPMPWNILYAGPAPGFAGLAQINVQLPAKGTGINVYPSLSIGTVELDGIFSSIWVR
jgi:uncharacterized protein (TIGR03437 family)